MHSIPHGSTIIFRIALCSCLLMAVGPSSVIAANSAIRWESKVDPWVFETSVDGPTEFLVVLEEQADLSEAASLQTKAEKSVFVYSILTKIANQSQPDVLKALADFSRISQTKIEYRAFWVANAIWVRGDAELIEMLARRSDIARLQANPSVHLEDLFLCRIRLNQPNQKRSNGISARSMHQLPGRLASTARAL